MTLSYSYAMTNLQCEDRVVSIGDYKQDVENICGPPTFVDISQAEKTIKIYQKISREKIDDQKHKSKNSEIKKKYDKKYQDNDQDIDENYRLINERTFLINIEEWTYNFGPSRFIQTLTFKNDQLFSIIAGYYGYDQPPSNSPSAEKGDSKALVMMKYGKPTYTLKNQEDSVSFNYRKDGDYLYVEKLMNPLEEIKWTYDFGPDRLLQKLSFKNNVLMDIRYLQKTTTN